MPGFFEKLFGKGKQQAEAIQVTQNTPINYDAMSHADVIARAKSVIQLQTQAHDQLFGLRASSWAVDLDEGAITFNTPKGMKAVAPVQVIGTLDTAAGTWMWGWDHPSVPAPCAVAAKKMLEYGQKRQLAELTTRVIPCDEDKAWEFTALADLLSDAQGGYRGPAGTTLVYMTFGGFTLSKQD